MRILHVRERNMVVFVKNNGEATLFLNRFINDLHAVLQNIKKRFISLNGSERIAVESIVIAVYDSQRGRPLHNDILMCLNRSCIPESLIFHLKNRSETLVNWKFEGF